MPIGIRDNVRFCSALNLIFRDREADDPFLHIAIFMIGLLLQAAVDPELDSLGCKCVFVLVDNLNTSTVSESLLQWQFAEIHKAQFRMVLDKYTHPHTHLQCSTYIIIHAHIHTHTHTYIYTHIYMCIYIHRERCYIYILQVYILQMSFGTQL